MSGSFLHLVHPHSWLTHLPLLGQGISLSLLLLGAWIAFDAAHSPRTSAWLAALGLASQAALFGLLGTASDSVWLLAAVAGCFLILWVLLTPLYLRFSRVLFPLLALLAGIWFVVDSTYLVASLITWGDTFPVRNWWHAGLLVFLALVLVQSRVLLHPIFRRLALAYVGCVLLVTGATGMGWLNREFLPTIADMPLLYLTLLTASVTLGHWSASRRAQSDDVLARYKPVQGLATTHLFLIVFTLITIYPVLWVFKMAATPERGFSMGLNPLPASLTHYLHAQRRGESDVATCYRRAMVQNFHELLGVGEACYDTICHTYRTYKDKRLLAQQTKICTSFAAAWRRPDAQRLQALAAWKSSILPTLTPRLPRPHAIKMLDDISYLQKKREKDGALFWRYLMNSIFVAAVTTFLGMLLACTAAYAFSRFRFPGRQTGLMSFLVSQMFPGTLMMIPLYILMSRLGLLDSLLGLSLVYSTTAIPFCVWMLKGYFDTIPKEIEEAALIDGASRTLIFWKIMLPLARPAIAVTALFSFMTAWNEFILAATFMNQETSYTLPVMLQKFVGEKSTDWGHFAAGAILVSLPIIFLFFVLQKHLVSGLTAGGVKG